MSKQEDGHNLSAQELMQRVLKLAEKGRYSTQPNPRVGCVIVNEGVIVGEGYHHSAGMLHAEREALEQAGELARGATAYVNLEPCCHQGRTPPCTDGLIDAGISRVVAAMSDPNPLVEGGGFEVLKMAGVDVEVGLMETEARWLNRGFINRMLQQKPWVILKSAATLDGKTAAYNGESKWITGEAARNNVQQIRASVSVIVTGIDTVLADDPQLNVRLINVQTGDQPRQPLRVVLDSQLRIPLEAKIIGSDRNCVIFTLSNDADKIAALTELGVEVIEQSNTGREKIDLNEMLNQLNQRQCNEVLVEAGQTLSGAFIDSNLVDELELFYAGSFLGDQANDMFKFKSAMAFMERPEYQIKCAEMVESDVKITAVNAQSVTALSN